MMPGSRMILTKAQGNQSWAAKQLTRQPTGQVPPGFWTDQLTQSTQKWYIDSLINPS
jgi:hypothetical protein